MTKPVLEIVITHWREPLCDCEKLFQSLAVQRGINPGECRVTIIQDGDEGALDTAEIMRAYPCIMRVIQIRHGGVSAARNAGIDNADADWIMFCDCDDMFYSSMSLRNLIGLARAAKDKDILFGNFLAEYRTVDGRWLYKPNGWNTVFIHAKLWRLDWVREKKLRFIEGLAFSEDQLFNAMAALETSEDRVAGMNDPVYVWCLRAGSCTADRENDPRNRDHAITRRAMMPGICMERGKPYQALTNAVRGILDSYHELTVVPIPEDERERLEKRAYAELIEPWRHAVGEIDKDDLTALIRVSRKSCGKKYENAERPTLHDWMEGLKAKYEQPG